eukprot:760679-Hanusia_phi.AAC.1
MEDGSGSDNEPTQQVVQVSIDVFLVAMTTSKVRVSKRETERAKELRKSSYGYMKEQVKT